MFRAKIGNTIKVSKTCISVFFQPKKKAVLIVAVYYKGGGVKQEKKKWCSIGNELFSFLLFLYYN